MDVIVISVVNYLFSHGMSHRYWIFYIHLAHIVDLSSHNLEYVFSQYDFDSLQVDYIPVSDLFNRNNFLTCLWPKLLN